MWATCRKWSRTHWRAPQQLKWAHGGGVQHDHLPAQLWQLSPPVLRRVRFSQISRPGMARSSRPLMSVRRRMLLVVEPMLLAIVPIWHVLALHVVTMPARRVAEGDGSPRCKAIALETFVSTKSAHLWGQGGKHIPEARKGGGPQECRNQRRMWTRTGDQRLLVQSGRIGGSVPTGLMSTRGTRTTSDSPLSRRMFFGRFYGNWLRGPRAAVSGQLQGPRRRGRR